MFLPGSPCPYRNDNRRPEETEFVGSRVSFLMRASAVRRTDEWTDGKPTGRCCKKMFGFGIFYVLGLCFNEATGGRGKASGGFTNEKKKPFC